MHRTKESDQKRNKAKQRASMSVSKQGLVREKLLTMQSLLRRLGEENLTTKGKENSGLPWA